MTFDQLVLLAESDDNIEVEREYYDKAKTKLQYEEWFKDSKYHRLDGPAVQRWDKNGNKIKEEYYVKGKELTPKEFKQLINQYDSDDLETFNDLTS